MIEGDQARIGIESFYSTMALDEFKYQIVILICNVYVRNRPFHINILQVITSFEIISNNSAHTQHLALQ